MKLGVLLGGVGLGGARACASARKWVKACVLAHIHARWHCAPLAPTSMHHACGRVQVCAMAHAHAHVRTRVQARTGACARKRVPMRARPRLLRQGQNS
eukprot:14370198-Alexandrium_andersonii.AAC.1